MNALKIISNFTNASLNVGNAIGNSPEDEELIFKIPFGDHVREVAMSPEKFVNDYESCFLDSDRGRYILVQMKALFEELKTRFKEGQQESVCSEIISDYDNSPGTEIYGREILAALYEVGDSEFREAYEENIDSLVELVGRHPITFDTSDALRIAVSLMYMSRSH
ncbi:hypothetical protein SYK_11850 [Pseudodesulfovibrio nedwellii]|uniref:Uncharacterized protein n=1 Tax=Pseudodesulfovibrio nedwellii TaxID=2973072 RepID=A0ABM8AZ68_9BACT|nr:hypothetical protein [Pseudodesulfovibrio nedwellii]BDQ36825.1 hypothetical protein SYK_11850 [Pseudodesulfovibrio nedwellii]